MEKENIRSGKIIDIKSPIIIKRILSLLYINTKLRIINYNKYLQKKIEIKIEDYKSHCRKVIIYKPNGIGVEFIINTNVIIYIGEYSKKRRNGKGKEYDINNKLIFKGEYRNGIKINGVGYDIAGQVILKLENGKGKEYYDNGNLKFEGEYFDGRRWNGKVYNYQGKEECVIKYGKGIIREYKNNGKLLYEGEYINGLRNGYGKEYFYNSKFDESIFRRVLPTICLPFDETRITKLKFEGKYLNGLRSGRGKEYYKTIIGSRVLFDGEYLNGLRNGIGTEYYIELQKSLIKYVGEYKNGKRNGKGKEYQENGEIIFEGEYLDGNRIK